MPTVDRTRYTTLPDYGKRLIRNWFHRAEVGLECDPQDSFEPFIYAWFALNSWAVCVTQEEQDRTWQEVISKDSALNREFQQALLTDADFKRRATDFYDLWPIFKVQDVRNRTSAPPASASSLLERQTRNQGWLAQGYQHEPNDWLTHANAGQKSPLDWKHTLQALARVRNNLFHGDKSSEELVDQTVVHHALPVLVSFLRSQNF